jgi:hypothetical protein
MFSGKLSVLMQHHELATADPRTAAITDDALLRHVVCIRTYKSAVQNYLKFCQVRGLVPWPTNDLRICGWMHNLKRTIKPSSIRMYITGVAHFHPLMGFEWTLRHSEAIRRTMRFIRREFPEKGKASKVPVSLRLLRLLFPQLPGWPKLMCMSQDDRVFVVASLLAVLGFLRGGEFLVSPNSNRPRLDMKDIEISSTGYLSIFIGQPKTAWWLEGVSVPLFPNTGDHCFCPVQRWREYVQLLPTSRAAASAPAFRLQSGKPLHKAWMLERTLDLMNKASVQFRDEQGQRIPLKAASWRAGGVRSALDAGISDQMIMRLGRWKTIAWSHYLFHSMSDMRGAALRMWEVSHGIKPEVTLLVDKLRPDSVCERADQVEEARSRPGGESSPP